LNWNLFHWKHIPFALASGTLTKLPMEIPHSLPASWGLPVMIVYIFTSSWNIINPRLHQVVLHQLWVPSGTSTVCCWTWHISK
jgi:hypothetical protein